MDECLKVSKQVSGRTFPPKCLKQWFSTLASCWNHTGAFKISWACPSWINQLRIFGGVRGFQIFQSPTDCNTQPGLSDSRSVVPGLAASASPGKISVSQTLPGNLPIPGLCGGLRSPASLTSSQKLLVLLVGVTLERPGLERLSFSPVLNRIRRRMEGGRRRCLLFWGQEAMEGGDRYCYIIFPLFLYFPIFFVDEESEPWGGAAICPKAGTEFFLKKRCNRVFTEHLLSTRHGSELGDQASSISPASSELTPASQGQSPGMGGLCWGLSSKMAGSGFLLPPYPGRRSRFIPRFLSPQALQRPKGEMMRSQ